MVTEVRPTSSRTTSLPDASGGIGMRQSSASGLGSTVALTVGVLGALDVAIAGEPVALSQRRLRTLLAVLAVSNGPVPVDRLAEAVWGVDLPRDARRSLHVYVTRLRAALGADAVRTVPNGYVLAAADVDATRFERLVDEAAGTPDPATERKLLFEALALWRGSPFQGVPSAWLEQVESPRLVERYVGALERRIDLDLGEADVIPDALVVELQDLTAQYPLRERFWRQLMVGLCRCGRQADALEAYQRLYRLLDDDLGIEPGREVRQLHHQILTDDPALDAPQVHRPNEVPVPRQLPPGMVDFTGRAEILDGLDAVLPARDATAADAVVQTTVIAGSAGVGKTALAVHWTHRVQERFPDGQLYVDLRGFDAAAPVQPTAAVRGFLDALGVPEHRVPHDPQAQIGLYRSLIAGRRMLVLVDNARDSEQVLPLLPGGRGSLALVTSRNELTALVARHGAHQVVLDVFTRDEARQLLVRRLGRDRIDAEPHAAADVISSCARLPLALAIIAARAARHPDFALAQLADELRDRQDRLNALSGADAATDVRAVFSWSYGALSAAAARLFRLLGLHPGPDIAEPAAASLAGADASQVRRLLAELTNAHLISEHRPGRYAFHDLLRAYAVYLAHDEGTDAERPRAIHRMLDHYLHTAHAAARLLNPHRHHPFGLCTPQAGVWPERLDDLPGALAWATAERAALQALVGMAADNGSDGHVWQLAWAIGSFLDRAGLWHAWADTQRVALAAAERLGNQSEQARAHGALARAYRQLDRTPEANIHLGHALQLYLRLGDEIGQGYTHASIGAVYEGQGRHVEAIGHAEQALALFRAADHRIGEALALNGIGWCHARLGSYREALASCREALPVQRALGDSYGESTTWDSLGYIHHHLAHYDQAVACYRRAAALRHDGGERLPEAQTLTRLGDAYLAAGDTRAAEQAWRKAVALLSDLGHPDVDAVRSRIWNSSGTSSMAIA
jgi:DNA-binding SARP family transcriptional activator/tetratricopeptide (TPR) repeat protein